MKISELIIELEKKKEKHGDVQCSAFQHPEEENTIQNISNLYFNKRDQRIHIS